MTPASGCGVALLLLLLLLWAFLATDPMTRRRLISNSV